MGESKRWTVVAKAAEPGLVRPWLEHAREYMPSAVGVEDPRTGVAVAVVFDPVTAAEVAAAPLMLEAFDPDTLEAIADEIGSDFKHSARADSLRVLARKQRAAIKAATGES